MATAGSRTRFALGASSAAIGVALLAAALSFVSLVASWSVGGWLIGAFAGPAALVVVAPLSVAAAAAMLGDAGVLGRRTARLLPVLALIAAAAAAVAALAWSAGFDDADQGRRVPPWLDRAELSAVLIGWAASAVVLATVLAALLRSSPMPRAVRAAVAVGVGVVAAPVLGVALVLGPGVGPVLLAAAAFVPALLHDQRGRPAAPPPPRTGPPPTGTVALALVGAAIGAGGIATAFAGGPLAWFGMDGTTAMNAGLALGALGAVPVAVAAGRLVAGRRRGRVVVLLLVAGAVLAAAAHGRGPSGDGVLVALLTASAALLLAAGAVVLQPRLPGSGAVRTVLAALLAVVALLLGGMLAAVLGFLVPIAAGVVLLAARPRRRRLAPAAA